jgi:predicted Zn-dependent protease with MMP-like domain
MNDFTSLLDQAIRELKSSKSRWSSEIAHFFGFDDDYLEEIGY